MRRTLGQFGHSGQPEPNEQFIQQLQATHVSAVCELYAQATVAALVHVVHPCIQQFEKLLALTWAQIVENTHIMLPCVTT